jgi:hypothetical protein
MRSRNRDARLAERALREAWPVPEERRPELVEILIGVARDPSARPRERVSAVKALLAASRLNLEALRVSMESEEFEVLVARLRALGGLPGEGPPGGGG